MTSLIVIAAIILITPVVLFVLGIRRYVRRADKRVMLLEFPEIYIPILGLYACLSLATLAASFSTFAGSASGWYVSLFWVYNLLCIASLTIVCLLGRNLTPIRLSLCPMFLIAGIVVNGIAIVYRNTYDVEALFFAFIYALNIAIVAAFLITALRLKKRGAFGSWPYATERLNRINAIICTRYPMWVLILLVPVFIAIVHYATTDNRIAALFGTSKDAYTYHTPKNKFIDARGSSRSYRTVTIGDYTWMAENLDYAMDKGGSWCYEGKESNCKEYGRLYTWEAAFDACPYGWRLPGEYEWGNLAEAAGGERSAPGGNYYYFDAAKKLKSKRGWRYADIAGRRERSSNDYKFSALPGGHRDPTGAFRDAGGSGYFWSAEVSRGSLGEGAYCIGMECGIDDVMVHSNSKGYGFSVRCVRDR